MPYIKICNGSAERQNLIRYLMTRYRGLVDHTTGDGRSVKRQVYRTEKKKSKQTLDFLVDLKLAEEELHSTEANWSANFLLSLRNANQLFKKLASLTRC